MKTIKFIFTILIPCFFVIGQQNLQTNQYILGGVTLSGNHNIQTSSILSIMNLSIGQKINLPGVEVSDGLSQLWDQNLFEDIQIYQKKIENNTIFLEIYLEAFSTLSKFKFSGIKKSEEDKLREDLKLTIGMAVSNNILQTSKNKVQKYFIEKGFLYTECQIETLADSTKSNRVILDFKITKNERLKIKTISFSGNNNVSSKKLKKLMKETKETGIKYLFSSSKMIKSNYKEDLDAIVGYYHQKGYRDALVLGDSLYVNEDGLLMLEVNIEEGSQYFFGEISWIGNKKYESEKLSTLLGISNGEIFDSALLEERLNMSRNGDDISALYMDDGYLFFQVNPVEVLLREGNYINLEMQVNEGKQATINQITITGNTKTNDHVIMREVRSLPGELFKRSDIIRTQEEFNRLGFFNPESLGVNPIPNPETGNVDIAYSVEERPADQVELQGGWGNGMFVGSFGVSFGNFSTKGISDKTSWDPLPSGDGQKISIRASSNGSYYQHYNLSFQEPWLGGKKPNSFSVALYKSVQSFNEGSTMKIFGLSLGLGKRIAWPDDYFTLQNNININRYKLEDYQTSLFDFSNGFSNNINLSTKITRNSIFNPIYPRNGSNFSISLELTPPYSLFSDKNYETMDDEEKFKFLEYKKIKTEGTWYNSISGNLVFKTHFEFGFLSAYNDDLGLPPFERFYVGGDGLSGYSVDGRELIGLRGYANNSLSSNEGSSVYSKYNIELRYPISLNPGSTIYALCFAEAGNSWSSLVEFKPFEVKRSIGMGVRIFMPMFGILGVDFGHGFDNIPLTNTKSGWQTHFTIGQQF